LPAPTNILISQQVISWDAVENSNGYVVIIDDLQTLTYETSFTSPIEFTPGGRYAIGVKALGRGNGNHTFKDSAPALVIHRQPVRYLNYNDFTPFGGEITPAPKGIRFGQSRYSGGSVAFIGSAGLYPNRTPDFFTFDARKNNLQPGQFIAAELAFNDSDGNFTDSIQFGVARCDVTYGLYATTLAGGLNFDGTFDHMMQRVRTGHGQRIDSLAEVRFETDFEAKMTTVYISEAAFDAPMRDGVTEMRYFWLFTNVQPHIDLLNVALG